MVDREIGPVDRQLQVLDAQDLSQRASSTMVRAPSESGSS